MVTMWRRKTHKPLMLAEDERLVDQLAFWRAIDKLNAAVEALRTELDRTKAEREHCSVCEDGKGCNAP